MSPAFHSFSLASFFAISCFAVAQRRGLSKSGVDRDSFSRRTSAIFSSVAQVRGAVMRRIRIRGLVDQVDGLIRQEPVADSGRPAARRRPGRRR
jgi:hypothetical protein